MKIKLLVVGPLLTNCYLVVSEIAETSSHLSLHPTSCGSATELLIIDPGGEGREILQEVKKTKAKVKYIVNTHGHPDHIFANEEIRKETGAKILIHEAEKNFVNFRADSFLKDGDEIKIGDSALKVLHMPGHTKGGICLLGSDFIFTGDTLFKDGYGRTDLPGGSEEDLEKSLEKLKKILKLGSLKPPFISRLTPLRGARRMTVYPGHGEIFKI